MSGGQNIVLEVRDVYFFSNTVQIIVSTWLKIVNLILKTMSHVIKCLFLATTDQIRMFGGQNSHIEVRDLKFSLLLFI